MLFTIFVWIVKIIVAVVIVGEYISLTNRITNLENKVDDLEKRG